MKRYSHIIFDLDGTLTDPGLGITNSIIYSLKKFGIESDRKQLYKFIGPPLRESFGLYYGFGREQAELAVTYYREYFSDRGIYENELYPGIYNLLCGLENLGKKMYIATSKPHEYTVRILEHFKIYRFFESVAASKMDGSMGEKSDLIGRIIPFIGGSSIAGTIMIGDRRYDIEGARYHNIDSAAVLYGYGDLNELRDAEPTYLVDSLENLATILLV